jgi:hypothetical protein
MRVIGLPTVATVLSQSVQRDKSCKQNRLWHLIAGSFSADWHYLEIKSFFLSISLVSSASLLIAAGLERLLHNPERS